MSAISANPFTIPANLLFLLVSSVTISANPFTIPANPFTIPANEKAPRSRGFRRKVNHSVAGFLFIFFVFQPSKATQAILVEFMLRSAAVLQLGNNKINAAVSVRRLSRVIR